MRVELENRSGINMQKKGINQSLVCFKRRHWSQIKKEIATAIWGVIINHTWRARNLKQFKDENVHRETVVTEIKQEIKERIDHIKCSKRAQRSSFFIQKFY